MGKIDPTLFTKKVNGELFICQLYVDAIIFGSTNTKFNDEFAKLMTNRFEMSMMGELEVVVEVVLLVLENPFGADNIAAMIGSLHESPHIIPLEVVEFLLH